jgi:hypothetical protein
MRNLKLKGEFLTGDLLPTVRTDVFREAAAADFSNERLIRACNQPLQAQAKILHNAGEKKIDSVKESYIFNITVMKTSIARGLYRLLHSYPRAISSS